MDISKIKVTTAADARVMSFNAKFNEINHFIDLIMEQIRRECDSSGGYEVMLSGEAAKFIKHGPGIKESVTMVLESAGYKIDFPVISWRGK